MARKNLIISFLGGVPASIQEMLKDDVIYAQCPVKQAPTYKNEETKEGLIWPGGRAGYQAWLSQYMDAGRNVIPGIARAHGLAAGDEIGKVCVFGFSNGCIGVDEVLGANDSQRIDVTLVVDGAHGSFNWKGMPEPAQYKNYANQAVHVGQFNAEADRNAPIMVITHSSIDPLAFPSTTMTADLIWSMVHPKMPNDYVSADCGWGCVPFLHLESIRARYAGAIECIPDASKGCRFAPDDPKQWWEGSMAWAGIEDGWYDRRAANNFYVLGWGYPEAGKYVCKDPAGTRDHIFQGQLVLKALLTEFVVQRWNAQCGAVAGLGQPQSCIPPAGQNYETAPAQKVDYFADLTTGTPVPMPCPQPPPGRKIVGSPTDPCALDEPYALPGESEPEKTSDTPKWLAAAAGFAVGYGLAWYGNKLYRTR